MGEAAPANSCTPQLYRPREPKNSLKYLGLWPARAKPGLVKIRPPPKIHSPPAELYANYSLAELGQADSQILPWDDDCSDPELPL